jgi:CheY-like chemotaxis protein
MNGWAFLRAQRQDPVLAAIPVILLSAVSDSETGDEPPRVVTHLTKPFAFEELLALLERSR